ncbi:hypothetical protein [Flavobacterium sp. WC2509]|uniref:hypothetical protein n=1 Tax=Flavobacterium sp. WC2509 TaxID=3461406 RepID=UPI004044346C
MKKAILILAIILSSCTKHNAFEEYLVNDKDNSFWVEKMMDSTGEYKYYSRQSVFLTDKTLKSLCSFKEDVIGSPQLILIEGGDIEKWSFNEKENTLTTSYLTTFKIKKYSKDTIFMKLTTAKKEHFILIRKRIK